MFTSNSRKGGLLSDSEYDMNVGVRSAGLSVSETANLPGFSHTTVSRVYSNGMRNKKRSSSAERNTLFMRNPSLDLINLKLSICSAPMLILSMKTKR